jgi:Dihydrodipicolinate synthase/N-acetylneuraminate lyase
MSGGGNPLESKETLSMADRIAGVLSPVVTPFKTDLSPDPERFVKQCRWLLSQNVGLAVFGTNSEANSLSTEEKVELLDRLVGGGVDPARMMPGTGCCALTDSVRLTAHAMKLGCGGVLMLRPSITRACPTRDSSRISRRSSSAWETGGCASTSTTSLPCRRWASRLV